MLFLFVVLHAAVAQVSAEIISCDANGGQRGSPGHVTCNFPADVSTLKPVIVTVERYAPNSQDAAEILECKWIAELTCTTRIRGYSFNNVITNELRLTVNRSSEDFEGRYVCKAMSRENKDKFEPKPCNFFLTGSSAGPLSSTIVPTEEGFQTTRTKEDHLWVLAVLAFAGVNLFGIYFFCLHEKCKRLCSRLFGSMCRGKPDEENTCFDEKQDILKHDAEASTQDEKFSFSEDDDEPATKPLLSRDEYKENPAALPVKVTVTDEKEQKGSASTETSTQNKDPQETSSEQPVSPTREKREESAYPASSLEKPVTAKTPERRGSDEESERADTESSDSDSGNDEREEIGQRLADHHIVRPLMTGRVMKSDLRKGKKNLKKTGRFEDLP